MTNDKTVLLNLRGVFADIVCGVNLEHKENVTYENVKNVHSSVVYHTWMYII